MRFWQFHDFFPKGKKLINIRCYIPVLANEHEQIMFFFETGRSTYPRYKIGVGELKTNCSCRKYIIAEAEGGTDTELLEKQSQATAQLLGGG